jgi:Methyltransferase domain
MFSVAPAIARGGHRSSTAQMPNWLNLFNPPSYIRQIEKLHFAILCWLKPNYRGAIDPGGYASPLLDIQNFDQVAKYDGKELWEFIDLRRDQQYSYFEDMLTNHVILDFPPLPSVGHAYFTTNGWFGATDAFTLAGVIQKERPRQIIEVGSGYSSAAILDVIAHFGLATKLTCIEPAPKRLLAVVDAAKRSDVRLIQSKVQDVPLSFFEGLDAGDILFVDSSHVAKIGSDVPWIFLRILPRLRKGVIVHFHDIFYPHSYPANWLRMAWAWNESLFLRAFLVDNRDFQVLAFNAYAAHEFPELFRSRFPAFLSGSGQSIWLRRVQAGR